jgi:hypothetical protein
VPCPSAGRMNISKQTYKSGDELYYEKMDKHRIAHLSSEDWSVQCFPRLYRRYIGLLEVIEAQLVGDPREM